VHALRGARIPIRYCWCFDILSSIFFSLSNKAFPMQQKPPANSQSPPIKGRAMPGVYNQMAELTEIKPETKNRWLIAHSPLVRTLGIFFTSCFDI